MKSKASLRPTRISLPNQKRNVRRRVLGTCKNGKKCDVVIPSINSNTSRYHLNFILTISETKWVINSTKKPPTASKSNVQSRN